MKTGPIRQRLERLGSLFFYILLHLFGLRSASLFLYPVILCYTLFSREIHRMTRPYLNHRFPGQNGLQRFFSVYRNLISFGRVLVDRAWLGLVKDAQLHGTIHGKEEMLTALSRGKGAVLLTAHMGNWQTAMANLDFLKVKVHALMHYDQMEATKHYFDLGSRQRSFEIIDSDGAFGGMIEATAALQRGEVVTIMADRYTRGTTKPVAFLGEEVRLPDAAYTLAACVGSPVIVFLAAKTGLKTYELRVWDIFYPLFKEREKRHEVLSACCRRFAAAMEGYLQEYPFQWYNFYDIWQQGNNETTSQPPTKAQ